MDAKLAARYTKGLTFYWQTFVSTSQVKSESHKFAKDNCGAGQTPFLFNIELPPFREYGPPFWLYNLSAVSAFPEEAEVLLMPFTQFVVTADPSMTDGVMYIHLKAVG